MTVEHNCTPHEDSGCTYPGPYPCQPDCPGLRPWTRPGRLPLRWTCLRCGKTWTVGRSRQGWVRDESVDLFDGEPQ